MKFVVPGFPLGIPPVTTTASPGFASPRSWSTRPTVSSISSVEPLAGTSTGVTPHTRASRRRVVSRGVNATIGRCGR